MVPKQLSPGRADKGCVTTEHYTPPWLLAVVRRYFVACGFAGIDLDPATDEDNWTGAASIFTAASSPSGLVRPWREPARARTSVWVNPPYGTALRSWVQKIDHEARGGCTVVALLPGQRFEQRYVQEILLDPARTSMEVAVAGRVSFYARVCATCDRLESDRTHRPDSAERCSFVWSGSRRPGLGNPYGSFLYLLGAGHDEAHARAILREVGCVRRAAWIEAFRPDPRGKRARSGIARPGGSRLATTETHADV